MDVRTRFGERARWLYGGVMELRPGGLFEMMFDK
jgi:hypothetical protein